MQRISVFIPDETRKRINMVAKAKNKAEAEIVRDALEHGLEKLHPKSSSAQALLDLAKLGEQIPTKPGTPTDISINHDYYAWGGEKRKK
jgi:predicted DNA-binding protein